MSDYQTAASAGSAGSTAKRRVDPHGAKQAIRGGIFGNYVDQFDIFLPVIVLAPQSRTSSVPTT